MKFKYEITLDVELQGDRKGIACDELGGTIRGKILDCLMVIEEITIIEGHLSVRVDKIRIK